MDHIDNLELQVGVIDSNVDEIRHEIQTMNHNLLAFFHSQNFFPPPRQGLLQWRHEEMKNLCLVSYVLLFSFSYILSIMLCNSMFLVYVMCFMFNVFHYVLFNEMCLCLCYCILLFIFMLCKMFGIKLSIDSCSIWGRIFHIPHIYLQARPCHIEAWLCLCWKKDRLREYKADTTKPISGLAVPHEKILAWRADTTKPK